MGTKVYGVLIHGAGWVSSQHIEAFKNNPHTRILAISSRCLATAQRRAVNAGLTDAVCYSDFDRALRHPGVDIVAICTPQHVHCENVLAAAQAGKHLLIEKPAGISQTQLGQMRQAVKRAGVKTVVSFVLRWNPLFQKLKQMSGQGAFGKIYSVEADYLSHNGSWWSGWSDTCTLRKGVSALLVGGCHAVDALRWFASPGQFEAAEPVEVFAMRGGYRKGTTAEYNPLTNSWTKDAPPMEYDGLENVLVRFANGVLGKVSVNFDCIMPYRFPIRIFGDRGTALDNCVWSHHYPRQKEWVALQQIRPESSDVTHHPFQAEVDHFVDCVQRDVESHCNLEDATWTHEVIFAALKCYRTGRPVRLRSKRGRDR